VNRTVGGLKIGILDKSILAPGIQPKGERAILVMRFTVPTENNDAGGYYRQAGDCDQKLSMLSHEPSISQSGWGRNHEQVTHKSKELPHAKASTPAKKTSHDSVNMILISPRSGSL
jgi:hypothetical protein